MADTGMLREYIVWISGDCRIQYRELAAFHYQHSTSSQFGSAAINRGFVRVTLWDFVGQKRNRLYRDSGGGFGKLTARSHSR